MKTVRIFPKFHSLKLDDANARIDMLMSLIRFGYFLHVFNLIIALYLLFKEWF